jgi:hypothetical protein
VDRDLDDTIIGPPRALAHPLDNDDTIVRMRRDIVAGRPRSPEPVPPPAPAYSFVVNSHQPISLDRPAYLGRKPSPPRIATVSRPRLVRVPSPLGEVSSTHLELRQEGTMVIATDLKSTNGTQVRLPGSAPTRLRQGESIVVTPGSIIEIGDGNVIEIHSLRRTYPSDPHLGATHS